jgi:hypothetical protein
MTHPLVVDGVSFWYVAVCPAQMAWSPAFVNEKILLLAVFMGLIFCGLDTIIFRQYNLVTEILEREVISHLDYWLLQFSFKIHVVTRHPWYHCNLLSLVVLTFLVIITRIS